MSEGFLSRWSRRKQERAGEALGSEPDPAPEPASAPSEGGAEGPEIEPGLLPDEVAALPAVEELTAESDITAFLRKGVPDLLRKAALRRAWALDPKIRDFVCEAREYAYDWNVPGGVPGAGPLLPTDDPQAMVERIFGRLRDPDINAEAAGETATAESPSGDAGASLGEREVDPLGSSSQPEASPALAPPPVPAPVRLSDAPNSPASPDGSLRRDEQPEPAPVRRHGGAMPA